MNEAKERETMLNIGCHLSIAKGFYRAGQDALELGANTFQFFTRNPRGGRAKPMEDDDVERLRQLTQENHFAPLFAHASYTMNLCSDREEVRSFAKAILREDLERIQVLPPSYYIFHPGSHVGQGIETGIQQIIDALNEAITEHTSVPVLLEGMSGKGTEVGKSLEELRWIIDGVKHNKNVGICLDTCHLYSAGYDIVNGLDAVIVQIDRIVGLKRLKAIHLNDSMSDYTSHKDRHAAIGKGTIGLQAIAAVINHPSLKDLVFNLETPNELSGYRDEIALLRCARRN